VQRRTEEDVDRIDGHSVDRIDTSEGLSLEARRKEEESVAGMTTINKKMAATPSVKKCVNE